MPGQYQLLASICIGKVLVQCVCFTRVVCQRFNGPIFTWGDQVPDEALDVLITTVMQQAIGQEGSADCFHVHLLKGALEATVSQDVTPPTPPIDKHETKGRSRQPKT